MKRLVRNTVVTLVALFVIGAALVGIVNLGNFLTEKVLHLPHDR